MPSRVEVKNPLDRVVDRAVAKSVTTMNMNMGTTGRSNLPATVTTNEGVDGGTIHPAIFGLDVFGDVNAVMTED